MRVLFLSISPALAISLQRGLKGVRETELHFTGGPIVPRLALPDDTQYAHQYRREFLRLRGDDNSNRTSEYSGAPGLQVCA